MYIEGFVTPVPVGNRQTYIDHALKAAAMIREFGATRFVECWGDDVPHGKVNDLHTAVQAKDDEAVLFSWFEYPDKATRDAANQKMRSDPRMAEFQDMPFDVGRMIYAGFDGLNVAGDGGEMGYVDGVVAPVETAKKDIYLDFCKKAASVFIENGATRVVDGWGDDVADGQTTDYRRAAQLTDGETVAYGWVEWPSKAVRDAAWEKLMQDERLTGGDRAMDGKRMMFGGFTPIIEE